MFVFKQNANPEFCSGIQKFYIFTVDRFVRQTAWTYKPCTKYDSYPNHITITVRYKMYDFYRIVA